MHEHTPFAFHYPIIILTQIIFRGKFHKIRVNCQVIPWRTLFIGQVISIRMPLLFLSPWIVGHSIIISRGRANGIGALPGWSLDNSVSSHQSQCQRHSAASGKVRRKRIEGGRHLWSQDWFYPRTRGGKLQWQRVLPCCPGKRDRPAEFHCGFCRWVIGALLCTRP